MQKCQYHHEISYSINQSINLFLPPMIMICLHSITVFTVALHRLEPWLLKTKHEQYSVLQYTVQCTVYCNILYTVQYTAIYCPLYSILQYTVHCRYIVHCTLYCRTSSVFKKHYKNACGVRQFKSNCSFLTVLEDFIVKKCYKSEEFYHFMFHTVSIFFC